ncbi:glycosyltransferase family 4 protein [Aetokthonos hydrillicola Thurmond2011]|jgi:glycosyltransferase involved in cell wall biosynthesis|uniref:Glycosyltransferase family 4 protein n=1 Tax=Aetokthonos hydrillicola Thurmond2011 TaxID=2712845 RepID=A0AAP5M8S8_9CYAN|nr:glycosyltransferase family 4 protein [Aetokthonos hydrillicola]MBO3460922.1 glycosyltransferase family 4 protein [Aetokthonos hydrillicola CCALA 1050]MBW4586471.1 glycosyltransferase family 4 protein [Aetokthonos hydrillicola CCALA 1050]MDR9893584.1 glycosyltransferase family 4 protein [Aetokthonos hydrillicola Thurmond2011]
MKIAVIGAKGLPPKQGGIEHYCAEVYPRMVNQGNSVDLFARSSYTESGWLSRYDFQGVQVISLPGLHTRGVDAFITSGLGAIAATAQKYDIVHFHALGPSLFTCVPKISPSTKVVVTCQGLDWQRAKWDSFSSRLIQMGEKAAVRFADELIVVSDALQNYFWQTYNRRTIYIPNAPASYAESDPDFNYGTELGLEKKRYILFLGRLVPEKRPDLLVQAFSALKPAGWKLVLAGGVSDTKSFTSQLLADVAKNRDIVFAGELRGDRLWEIVRGSGLFVLPSDLEGLPLAMLEAMQEGIPVLASNIPPHQQLISGGRGMLFEAGNLESCICSLEWAMAHPQELAVMAKKAQRSVQINYSWDRITSETLKVYTTLLNSSKRVSISEHRESKLAGVIGKK